MKMKKNGKMKKKRKNERKERKRGLPRGYHPFFPPSLLSPVSHPSSRDGSKKMVFLFERNVTRNRAAIEVKSKEKVKRTTRKKTAKKKKPDPWARKVALRPSGVLLVFRVEESGTEAMRDSFVASW